MDIAERFKGKVDYAKPLNPTVHYITPGELMEAVEEIERLRSIISQYENVQNCEKCGATVVNKIAING